MKMERYEHGRKSSDSHEYCFTSVGPKGEIPIIVQFKQTEIPEFVNLAFGNELPGGGLDHLARNGNNDRNKILATVAVAIIEFTNEHPNKIIFFSGSTPARTRLYRMAITLHLEELQKQFDVFGIFRSDSGTYSEEFRKEISYNSFAVIRKPLNL